MILSEHLVHCDTDGMDFKTPWYMWTVGRLQQVFMMVSGYMYHNLKFRMIFMFRFFEKVHTNRFNYFFQHHEQVEKYSTTLETLLFTQDLDPNILDVFQQFVALRM